MFLFKVNQPGSFFYILVFSNFFFHVAATFRFCPMAIRCRGGRQMGGKRGVVCLSLRSSPNTSYLSRGRNFYRSMHANEKRRGSVCPAFPYALFFLPSRNNAKTEILLLPFWWGGISTISHKETIPPIRDCPEITRRRYFHILDTPPPHTSIGIHYNSYTLIWFWSTVRYGNHLPWPS